MVFHGSVRSPPGYASRNIPAHENEYDGRVEAVRESPMKNIQASVDISGNSYHKDGIPEIIHEPSNRDFSDECSVTLSQATGCEISELASDSEFSELGKVYKLFINPVCKLGITLLYGFCILVKGVPVSEGSGSETATETDYGNIEKLKKNRQKKKQKGLKEVPSYTDAEVEKLAEEFKNKNSAGHKVGRIRRTHQKKPSKSSVNNTTTKKKSKKSKISKTGQLL